MTYHNNRNELIVEIREYVNYSKSITPMADRGQVRSWSGQTAGGHNHSRNPETVRHSNTEGRNRATTASTRQHNHRKNTSLGSRFSTEAERILKPPTTTIVDMPTRLPVKARHPYQYIGNRWHK